MKVLYLRVTESLHEAIENTAYREHQSMNAWCIQQLQAAAEETDLEAEDDTTLEDMERQTPLRRIVGALALCLLLPVAAQAQLQRYTGSTPGQATLYLVDDIPDSRYFNQYAGVSATLQGIWTIDLTTDGQAIQWDDFSWTFSTTAPLDHHIGQIDFALDAEVFLRPSTTGYDLNPINVDFTREAKFDFQSSISGHYRSLDFQSEFPLLTSDNTGHTFYRFDFSDWETSLPMTVDPQVNQSMMAPFWTPFREDRPNYLVEPHLYIRGVEFDLPEAVLTRQIAGGVAPVTGNDFLAWQRDYSGPADAFALLDWERAFTSQGNPGVGGGVPEPASWALIVAALLASYVFWRAGKVDAHWPYQMKVIFWFTVGAGVGGCMLMWMSVSFAMGGVLWLLGFVAAAISGLALISVDWTGK